MAHFTTQAGLDNITGALRKHKQDQITITRRKSIKDPITGEVAKQGPKEIYIQKRRDYDRNPLTDKESNQLSKWTLACRLAPQIFKDKNHPRFMEMYQLWQQHVHDNDEPMPFPNFVRSVLVKEL